MAKKGTAKCTKIEKTLNEYIVIGAGFEEFYTIMAEKYDCNYEEGRVHFFINDELIASFKVWTGVIKQLRSNAVKEPLM